jgi:hypothetical protein
MSTTHCGEEQELLMPYTGKFTDHFAIRSYDSMEDRSLIKVRDLYRLGPYRAESWRHDVVTYAQRLVHKLRDKPAPVGNLRKALHQVVLFPTRLGLIGVRLQLRLPDVKRYISPSTWKVAVLRVNHYLATTGDEQAIELVIRECLGLAVSAQTPEIQNDYIRAAIGWAVHLNRFDWPEYSRRGQTEVWFAGDEILFSTFMVFAEKLAGRTE